MALQRTTKSVIENAVNNRKDFKRGNVSGKYHDSRYFTGSVGMLDSAYGKVLREHNHNSGVFVLYSYQTPMAWYVVEERKWYYVDHKYSPSTTQHQHAIRDALKGGNVVVLTQIFDNAETGVEVAEMEQKYFKGLYVS